MSQTRQTQKKKLRTGQLLQLLESESSLRADFLREYRYLYTSLLPWGSIDVAQDRLFEVMSNYTRLFDPRKKETVWLTQVVNARSAALLRPTVRDETKHPSEMGVHGNYTLWIDPGTSPSGMPRELLTVCERILFENGFKRFESLREMQAARVLGLCCDTAYLIRHYGMTGFHTIGVHDVFHNPDHFYTRERLLTAIALRNVLILRGMFHQIEHEKPLGTVLGLLSALETALRMGLSFMFVVPSSRFAKITDTVERYGACYKTDDQRFVFYGHATYASEKVDEEGRFHSWTKPAFVRNGSFSFNTYALIGELVNWQIIEEPDSFDVETLMSILNQEVRSLILKRMGPESLIKRFKAKVLDTNNEHQCKLVGVDEHRSVVVTDTTVYYRHVFLLLTDHSTARQYMLEVPPEMRTCEEALAWSFGLEKAADYQPVLQT